MPFQDFRGCLGHLLVNPLVTDECDVEFDFFTGASAAIGARGHALVYTVKMNCTIR